MQQENELNRLRQDLLITKNKAFDMIEDITNQKAKVLAELEQWKGVISKMGKILRMGETFSIDELITKLEALIKIDKRPLEINITEGKKPSSKTKKVIGAKK